MKLFLNIRFVFINVEIGELVVNGIMRRFLLSLFKKDFYLSMDEMEEMKVVVLSWLCEYWDWVDYDFVRDLF